MEDAFARLTDLGTMHPRLSWDDIVPATAAVLGQSGAVSPWGLELAVANLPGYGTARLRLVLDAVGVSVDRVRQLQRTYEPSRLVEMAAIAVAALGVYYAGGSEIHDVALRGMGADYMIGEAGHVFEVAGRSRRSDLQAAWDQRWQRLADRSERGFYLCVVEFETPAGRLAFGEL